MCSVADMLVMLSLKKALLGRQDNAKGEEDRRWELAVLAVVQESNLSVSLQGNKARIADNVGV